MALPLATAFCGPARDAPAAAPSRRSEFLRGASLGVVECPRPAARGRSAAVSAQYKGRGTDRSRVPEFQRHDKDTGSTEVQIARLSARVSQLTEHLKANKKDFATERGLKSILGRRRRLLNYLYRTDREKLETVVKDLGIRYKTQEARTN
ncbi:unnamed protein product [Ostreobium quekettii]|uniref:30S ribosomal protein S15 n=1 Tax=Ostreobium quekettii TaxID=121088 RepID=A0A8S1J004_9CHLO|nr:unnamed protein product [Ostreobium quekettii]